jgi:serine/threonine protein phosphatase PrpC
VLCCDGVWDLISRQEIAHACGMDSVAQASERLIGLALERGAHDNVTVLIVHVNGDLTELPKDKGRGGGGVGLLQRLGLARPKVAPVEEESDGEPT